MQETSLLSQTNETNPKSKLFTYILIALIVLIGGYFLINSNKEIVNDNIQEEENSSIENAQPKQITLDEISVHNVKTDCWTTVNGEVFDLTKFISIHKGGDKILNACGVDATDYFTGKHPTIGRVHSQVAVKLLSGMKIGDLKK